MIESKPHIQMSASANVLFLAGRTFAALSFMALALGQVFHFPDAVSAAQSLGMPAADLYVTMSSAMQFTGSLMLGLGYRARLGAVILAASLLPTIWLFCDASANRLYLAGVFAALGGLLPYVAMGSGHYGIDGMRHHFHSQAIVKHDINL